MSSNKLNVAYIRSHTMNLGQFTCKVPMTEEESTDNLGIFPLRQFPLCQFPLCKFPFGQLPTLSIPKVDKVGIDKKIDGVGIGKALFFKKLCNAVYMN